MVPPSRTKIANPRMMPRLNRTFRNRPKSTIGCLAPFSRTKKATAPRAEPAKSRKIRGWLNPSCWPLVMARA